MRKQITPIGSKRDKIFFSHLVYIKNEVTNEFGTGVIIDNLKDYYVLTASHVIQNAMESQLYLNLGIGYRSSLENIKILTSDNSTGLDYAIIHCSRFETQIKFGKHNKPFVFNRKEELSDVSDFNRTTITGYPNELVKSTLDFPQRIYFSIWNKMPTPFESCPSEIKELIDKKYFLVFDFHPNRTDQFVDEKGNKQDIFDLSGMSGCPVWIFNKDSINDEQPLYALYGIYVSTYNVNKFWIFTKVDSIFNDAKDKFNINLLVDNTN